MESVVHAYYLRSALQSEAVSLLERSGVGGYAWPSANGWIPFVVRGWGRSGALLNSLSPTDALLRFTAAENSGWSFELFSREKCFLRYARFWAPSERIEHQLIDENMTLLVRLVMDHNPRHAGGISEADLRAELKAVLFPAGGDSETKLPRPSDPSYRLFASLLALQPCEGLFYDELPSDIAESGIGVVRVARDSISSRISTAEGSKEVKVRKT